MKTKRYINFLILIMFLTISSCQEDEETEMRDISLNKSTLTLVLGDSETLTVTPEYQDVVWKSTNTDVVTVDNGVINTVGLGDAIVNAISGKSRTFCEVSVINEPIDVTGVSITISDTVLAIGESAVLEAIVSPDSATYKNVKWSSSNPDIVSVDDLTGEIIALALGEATITVTTVDGEKTATCNVQVLPSLLLNRPYNNTLISLDPTDAAGKIIFSWIPFEGTTEYVLKINLTEDFQSPLYEKDVTGSSTDISSFELNEIIKENTTKETVNVFWTIHPKEPIDVIGEIRKLDIIPDRHEYLTLLSETATNLTISEDEGKYQYSLSATDGAYVNTSALTTVLHPDSNMFSFMYKSTQEIPDMKILFIQADGTEVGSISTSTMPSSAGWTEFAVSAKNALNNFSWGNVGDYIKLNFQDTWQGEINGIHFRGMTYQEIKDNYVPQIFTLVHYSKFTMLEEISEYHYKIITTGHDPNVKTSKLTEDLPNGACMLVFEYKSDQQLLNNLIIFGGIPQEGLLLDNILRLGSVAPASEWTEYQIDMIPVIEGGWGVAGSYMRLDPGERSDYEMEIRNIRIEFKD